MTHELLTDIASWNALGADRPRNLSGATLHDLDLSGADLCDVDLSTAELQRCRLVGSNLSGADLSGAWLSRCVLRDCDLAGAQLSDLALDGCERAGNRGLEVALGLASLEVDGASVELPTVDHGQHNADLLHYAEVLPAGFGLMNWAERLDHLGQWATIDRGPTLDDAAIATLQHDLGLVLPADLCTFLREVGRLTVQGSAGYAFGRVTVFGTDLREARGQLRNHIDDWGGDRPSDWRSQPVPQLEVELPPLFTSSRRRPEPTLEDKRARLLRKLKLTPEELPVFHDDLHDEMRVAWSHMVPLVDAGEDLHRRADCLGPRQRVYVVSAKGWSVDPPLGSFTQSVFEALGGLILGERDALRGPR